MSCLGLSTLRVRSGRVTVEFVVLSWLPEHREKLNVPPWLARLLMPGILVVDSGDI